MKIIKILLVLCITLFYAKILLAEDFTLTQSIKWIMGSEIETSSGKLRGVSVEGTYIDSRGYKGTITCIGSAGEQFRADCHLKDEDGDIIYADALRKGVDGVSRCLEVQESIKILMVTVYIKLLILIEKHQ